MNVDFADMGGGIVQDLPPEQIQRNQWSSGNNARFVRAQASKIQGHREVFGTVCASSTIGSLALDQAIWLNHINDSSGQPWWVYCSQEFIYATDGANHYDVTYSATASSSITGTTGALAATLDYGWNGGNFNGLVVMNSHAQLPRYWDPGSGNRTKELTVSGVFTACRVLRPYKTFLMAIGINEGSGFNDNLVLWPTAAEVGGLPPSWDYNDTTQDASRVELNDGFGILLDGGRLRNDFFVYAEHAIYRFSPVPTNEIFAIRRQFSEVGLLTRNCIATVRHRHVFFGDGDIYVHDGQSMDSIVTKRWKQWVFSQIGSNWQRSYVATNYANNEVWFCFPVADDTFPTKALIWDFDDNTLSSRDLIEAGDTDGASFIAHGRLPTSGDDSFDGGADLTFDEETLILFDSSDTETNVRDLVMVSYAGVRHVQASGQVNPVFFNTLQDQSASFSSDVAVGDLAINLDTDVTSTVASLTSETVINLGGNPYQVEGERYQIVTGGDRVSDFFEIDSGFKFDQNSFTFYLEKDCLPLSRNGKFTQYEEYQINAIRPRVRSEIGGTVTVKVGARDSVGDTLVYQDQGTFTIGTSDKVDVRVTGTVITVRFESDSDADIEVNGFGVDYDIVGSRPR